MAKAKQNPVVSFPAAKVVGDVEQTMRTVIDPRTGIKTDTIAREETLAYVKDETQRMQVLSGASDASKSLCAVCLSIVADVINDTPHIANMAQEAKAWKGAFAKVEAQYFPNGTVQMWQTVKSTVKAWLAKDPHALTGDNVVMTADGQLNSLRYLKSLTPKAERVSQSVAEKVLEACAKDNGPVVEEVIAEIMAKTDNVTAIVEAVIDQIGEATLRNILAKRIKAKRSGLKLAA